MSSWSSGQDGLVANVAKYLDGQPVIGVDPEPGRNAGVLVRHAPQAFRGRPRGRRRPARPVEDADDGRGGARRRAGARRAERGLRRPPDATSRARYRLRRKAGGAAVVVRPHRLDRHGRDGWCRSISRQSHSALALPSRRAARSCGSCAKHGPHRNRHLARRRRARAGSALRLVAETDGLVVFGDGIESDRLTLGWGQEIRVRLAERSLRLVLRPIREAPSQGTSLTADRAGVRRVGRPRLPRDASARRARAAGGECGCAPSRR